MSKIDNNPILKGVSGLLGETVQFRTIHGRMQLANKPKRRKSQTDKQLKVQSRFALAADYANQQLKTAEALEMYSAGITSKLTSAYLVAVSDYLNAPKVESIDTLYYNGSVGAPISVIASDDFMVKAVKVVITGANGKELEQGDATPDPEVANRWLYKATVANPTVKGTTIRFDVTDRPGNRTSASRTL